MAAWTPDELYGSSYDFLDGLDELGQTHVTEFPCTFCGWSKGPVVLCRPTPQDLRRKGRKRRFPRLSATAASVRFFMLRNKFPTHAHWLIVTRHPQSGEQKFFVSNASARVPLEWLLHVAYSRRPMEQCFREEKDELGFDHFEVRRWQSIHRHMYLSHVSHLFVNKMRWQLVAEEPTATHIDPVGTDDVSPGTQVSPPYPPESLNVDQVRYALSQWFLSLRYGRHARRILLEDPAALIAYHRRHNNEAKPSHTRTMRRTLLESGIDVDRIRSWLESNFALYR